MTLPSFVNETLTSLDTNWNTTNADKPTLIDGDEERDFNDDSRAQSVSALHENVITVDSGPTGSNEIVASDFDNKFRQGTDVIVEAYHTDGGGQVANKSVFNGIVGEARRAILEDRDADRSSADEYGILFSFIGDEDDRSAEQGVDAHYFRYEFPVFYEGFESLP